MNEEKQVIILDKGVLEYSIFRKNVKNINLRVKRNGEVVVSANHNVPLVYIEKFIKSKEGWIFNRIYFLKNRVCKSYEEDGYFLGKKYNFKIVKDARNYIAINKNTLIMHSLWINNHEKNRDIYKKWMRQQANKYFTDSLDRMYKFIRPYGIEKPNMFIRKMKSRWGSCFKYKQKINLNLYLIRCPIECIDYVVLHELTHLIHFNHSKKFYDLLTSFMPDWKKRRDLLSS